MKCLFWDLNLSSIEIKNSVPWLCWPHSKGSATACGLQLQGEGGERGGQTGHTDRLSPWLSSTVPTVCSRPISKPALGSETLKHTELPSIHFHDSPVPFLSTSSFLLVPTQPFKIQLQVPPPAMASLTSSGRGDIPSPSAHRHHCPYCNVAGYYNRLA